MRRYRTNENDGEERESNKISNNNLIIPHYSKIQNLLQP